MRKNLPIVFALVFTFLNTHAQQVYKSGGTTSSTFLLGIASYAAKSQCIFLPSDLANRSSGNITTIFYKYGINGGLNQHLYNFSIQIGQTTANEFRSGNEFFTNLTPVLSSSDFMIPAGTPGSWFPINLDIPYVYKDSKTLIVQITFDSCDVESWGTMGTNNHPTKKIVSGDVNALTGNAQTSTWQDFGFDITPDGISTLTPTIFKLDVSPNPSPGKISVSIQGLTDYKKVSLSMMNVLGVIVFQKNVLVSELMNYDVSGWPKGLYVLRAVMDGLQVSKKVLIE